MNQSILQYVEPIFRFCLKRLSSRADAEDLSQEILMHILQSTTGKDIANLNAYVWRIAHNRYARFIGKKNGSPVVLYGFDRFPETAEAEPEDDMPELKQAAFNALHTLSAMYRDIVVDYYVRQLDTKQISHRYGISVETVKWRLHAGREKMRERMTHMEKNYEHIKMHVMCNGGFNPTKYLDTQLKKAIAKVCYNAPLSLEEISLATGVPTLYLPEILDHMVWGDALEQVGNKYATNFIITPSGAGMDSFLTEAELSEITDTMWSYIQSTSSQFRGIGFYGSDFPIEHLLHILVPLIVYAKSSNNEHQQFPQRKDGGFGWFIVNEGIEELDHCFAGANGYHENDSTTHRFNYFWVGDTFSKDLNQRLGLIIRFFPDAMDKAEDQAMARSHNLCRDVNGQIMPTIPILSEDEYSRLKEWANGCIGFEKLWQKWINALHAAYKNFTPKRLHDQIEGNVNAQSFNLSAYILKELQKRGLASVANPSPGEIFTNNVFMVR